MRIKLGVFVGCVLLVHGSRAEIGKTAVVERGVTSPLPVDPGGGWVDLRERIEDSLDVLG